MHPKVSLADALALLLGLAGCGTYARGLDQKVHFESLPAGAEITETYTGEKLVTPGDLAMWRGRSHVLVASMPGYLPAAIYVYPRRVYDEWYIMNFLTLLVGFYYDHYSGGAYELVPERVTVVLDPAPPTSP